ncbi:MAG TPA: DUF882 domain-containing protein [Steroidobacteraceae bacterium]|nr:DUF882 domain-containing protein [Steroidobacteraceae bacterium]
MQAFHRGFRDRRRLLKWLALGPAALSLALRDGPALADGLDVEKLALAPRELSMLNLHTGEQLEVRYFEDGRYLPGALAQLDHLLRDYRNGEVTTIDPRLFDVLHAVAAGARCAPRYEVISGYRSPATNQMLRATTEGVAQHSLHIEGRAIDVRLPRVNCAQLRDLALGLRRGGVGYYARSNFVHLDTGPVRSWRG